MYEWFKFHNKTCKYIRKPGEDKLTYMFKNTNDGWIIKIRCECGEEIIINEDKNN
jgi:hypothetical protein